MRPGAIAGVLAAAVALTAGCGGDSPPKAKEPPAEVRLTGCWMTVHLFRAPAAQLRRLVPAGYRTGDYFGPRDPALALWALACDRVAAGRRPRPAVLTLVGVQVAPPGAPADETGPASFHHYLLGADTNDPALRDALRAARQPARLIPGLAFRREGSTARVADPAPRGGFTAVVRARRLDRPHTHDNYFWVGAGPRRRGFELRVPHANDRYCLRSGRGCLASVTAARDSLLWRLVGARAPAHAATGFDHLRIRSGTLILRRRGGKNPPR